MWSEAEALSEYGVVFEQFIYLFMLRTQLDEGRSKAQDQAAD
jgi:hypothetical protein